MTCNQAAQSCRNDEHFQHDCASPIVEGFVEELEDGDARVRGDNVCKIPDNGEEHGDGEEPARYEANGYRAHDGNWYHFFRTVHFFGEMGGAIEACKTPVGVDETDDEGDAALFPASVVDEGGEDERGILVGGCNGRNGDEYHNEGE